MDVTFLHPAWLCESGVDAGVDGYWVHCTPYRLCMQVVAAVGLIRTFRSGSWRCSHRRADREHPDFDVHGDDDGATSGRAS
jgi:hypothetical protein